MKILVGADPELFAKQDGQYVSAHGMIDGDKENPLVVRNGAVQIDGTALEFNIDPATDGDDWVMKLDDVMAQLKGMVPGYEVVADPVAYYGEEYLAGLPKEAKILGCDPDFNAWEGGSENQPPDVSTPFRTGAGHVHIGWGEGFKPMTHEHMLMCIPVIKQLDLYLGLPSLVYDSNTDRRTLYGAAGAFRPKVYGAEYRVLSNKWLSSEKLMRHVYDNTIAAMKQLMAGNMAFEKYGDDIRNAIRFSDVDTAEAIMREEGIKYEV